MDGKLVPWPEDAKCAVAFTFDMDADSFLHLGRPHDSYRRIAVTSELRFGRWKVCPEFLTSIESMILNSLFYSCMVYRTVSSGD